MTVQAGVTTDQSGALIDMMDAAEAAGGGVVTLPEGDILFTNPIPAKQFVHVRGSHQDATRCYFEGSGYDFAFDIKGSGVGAHPADRLYSGISNMTINGDGLSSSSECGGVRLGHNHRSRNLLENLRVTRFPGDGVLLDANNWNIAMTHVSIDDNAYRKSGASGLRKNPSVTDINFCVIHDLTVEANGNPTTPGLCGGINIQTNTLSTNRGWLWSGVQAEGNHGIVEFYMRNMLGQNIQSLYIEMVHAGRVGAEFENVQGVITCPDLHAASSWGATKAMKFYGNSQVALIGYRRGSGWATNELETYGTSRISLVGCDPGLRVARYESSVIA